MVLSFILVGSLAACDSTGDVDVDVVLFDGSSVMWETVPLWEASVQDGLVTLHFTLYEIEPTNPYEITAEVQIGEMLTLTFRDREASLPAYVSLTRSPAPGWTGSIKPLRMGPFNGGTRSTSTSGI